MYTHNACQVFKSGQTLTFKTKTVRVDFSIVINTPLGTAEQAEIAGRQVETKRSFVFGTERQF